MPEAAKHHATWDDLLDVPQGCIGEIVDGDLVVQPRPGPPHSETASDLGGILTPAFKFGRGGPGGWVIIDEPDLSLLDDIRVPDLAGWRVQRYRRPAAGPYLVVPDWICEVLSPSTAVNDRIRKLPLYQRAGVDFVWLVDPIGFSLEAYQRQEHGSLLLVTAGGRDIVRVPPFDAIERELALLWGDRFEESGSESGSNA